MQLLFCGEQTGMKICETLGTLGLQKKVLKSLLSTTHMFRQKKSMRGASAFQAGIWHWVEELYFLCFGVL